MINEGIASYQIGYFPQFLPMSHQDKCLPNPTYFATLTYLLVNLSDSTIAKQNVEMENMRA
jgi:hypothetical protein